MLTSHNLVIFWKWDGFLLANGGLEKASDHLPFILCPYPRSLDSFIRYWSWGHLDPRSLTLTGLPSFSIPFQNKHALFPNHLLSCPHLIQRPLAFLKDPLPEIRGPMYGLSPNPFLSQACLLFILPFLNGSSCPYLVG